MRNAKRDVKFFYMIAGLFGFFMFFFGVLAVISMQKMNAPRHYMLAAIMLMPSALLIIISSSIGLAKLPADSENTRS